MRQWRVFQAYQKQVHMNEGKIKHVFKVPKSNEYSLKKRGQWWDLNTWGIFIKIRVS